MDMLQHIQHLRDLADELERQMWTHQYKGIDPATATDAELEWAKSMNRTEVVREIEAARAAGRTADRGDVGNGADGASGGDGGTTPAEPKAVEDMTADELRDELRRAELPVGGAKPDLQERLKAHREKAA